MPEKKTIHFYLDSDWDFKPPVIRIWIDNFLISERGVTPRKKNNEYLEEIVTINFKKGLHKIIVENIKTALAEIKLHKIIMEDEEIPFKTKDGIYYEAKLRI
jgi:hypothetical protein